MATPYRFGRFELEPDARQLLADGRPVALGQRAFDLLVALIERRDRLVGKKELLDVVWPGLVVEENNLQVQVSQLRKLLGPQAIATVPGRGYRFKAALEGAAAPAPSRPPRRHAPRPHNLPATCRRFMGATPRSRALGPPTGAQARHGPRCRRHRQEPPRASVRALVARTLGRRRVDGRACRGIGPRTAAQHRRASARHQAHRFCGLQADSSPPRRSHAAPRARQLRAPARRRCRARRRAPARGTGGDAARHEPGTAAPCRRAAIPLDAAPPSSEFERRRARMRCARAVRSTRTGDRSAFRVERRELPLAIDVCRRLDGLPLAIELAAGRVATLGLRRLRDKLDARFKLLTGGARATLRRHQTLRAALEWSHNLLDDAERVVFRRLGVFAGGFTIELAQAVASDDDLDEWAVLDHLAALVDKSLVALDPGETPRYRLLESARAFALEQLAATATDDVVRRHALAMRAFVERVDSSNLDGELPNRRICGHRAAGARQLARGSCVGNHRRRRRGDRRRHCRALRIADRLCLRMRRLAARVPTLRGKRSPRVPRSPPATTRAIAARNMSVRVPIAEQADGSAARAGVIPRARPAAPRVFERDPVSQYLGQLDDAARRNAPSKKRARSCARTGPRSFASAPTTRKRARRHAPAASRTPLR